MTHSKLLHILCMLLKRHTATQYWHILSGSSRGWHWTPHHLIFYADKSLICGTTVLGGATPLCHHIIQLISLEQHGEEMYLSLSLCLGFLYSTLQASEQQYLLCCWSCCGPAESLLHNGAKLTRDTSDTGIECAVSCAQVHIDWKARRQPRCL